MEIRTAEAEYKWLEAAKLLEQTFQTDSPTGFPAAECLRIIGYYYELASRQANSTEDFRKLRQLSCDAYKKASISFGGEPSLENEGKRDQCDAQAEYVRSWIALDSEEKTKILDKCRAKAKNAMQIFQTTENSLSYGQTANLLTKCLFDRLYLASTAKEKSQIIQEAIGIAVNAILVLSKLDATEDQIVAFSQASILNWYWAIFSENEEERKTAEDNSISNAAKAMALSEKVPSSFYKAVSLWGAVWSNLYFTDDIEISLNYAKQMLTQASLAQDNFFRGVAAFMIADVTDQKVLNEGDPDKRKNLYDEIIKYSEVGIHYLSLVFQDSLIAEAYPLPAQTYSTLASDFSLSLQEKHVYSKKAIDMGKKGLEHAIRSGSPEAMLTTLHGLSKAYYYYSNLEPRKDRKPELLNEALQYRKDLIKIVKDAFTWNYWVLGVGIVYSAQIETDLSRLEEDEKRKVMIMKKAIADMEQGVSLGKNWVASRPVPSFVASVAGYEDSLGGILDECFRLTAEKSNLTRANEVYLDAAEDFKKVDLPSRVAESYWKIGKNYDGISEFNLSARNFENAFAAYKATAQRISQFSDFYIDYASYMKAWSEIELAKKAHDEEKFNLAMQNYEKASQLLRQSKSWMYLSQNFFAWSLLEQAEDCSRKDNGQESIEAFEKAIKFLQESKRILGLKLEGVDKTDEKDLINKLIQVSETREEHSHGRIALEQARCLYKKGEYMESSNKYGKAATIFQRISLTGSKQARREASHLNYLCQAWEKMTMGEAQASPIMYEEAADLFKLAQEHSVKESTGLMALGHSSFCRALESGTEYQITRTRAMYEEAVRHLDAAADYYHKAGFEETSDYAKATQRLFDAYVFMESAKRERDPEKQRKYYSMAEIVLQNAVEYFEKAHYTSKAEQAKEFLKRIREERKFALSLEEIFHAPEVTTSTASFSSITSRDESAVGLERFEHADIQIKIVQYETDIKVGNTITIEIQIINVGKEPISLIRIEKLIPAGFQLVSKPDYCQFENSQLVMKGKRLDPLKTDEIKIALRSFKKGTVEIKPCIVCLDWVGRQVVFNPEPIVFHISTAILPGRISTGYSDLDSLLFGGIPENYAVILESPSSDECELLIKRFLEEGVKNGQTTCLITSDISNTTDLAENFQAIFSVFLCNPRAEVVAKNIPIACKLKGVENLTEIDIALTKAFRVLNPQQTSPRRMCITILSDVLLQHHPLITRKWISGLLAELKSKGFTTLAVINQEMHPPEEVQALVGLFEGEIKVSEKEKEMGLEKILRIRKLCNQRYLDSEIILTREKLEC
jgi:KaiC/GvpD/RAD55 family RecA-like ATPase